MRPRLPICSRLLAGAILYASPACLRAQTIDTIIVVRHNIYERGQHVPGFLATFANALHVRTRQSVILRTLLVKPGQPYDSARVAESERALRSLGIFHSVHLDTLRVDGRFALRAETADDWTTIPDFDYLVTAGDVMWAVILSEANLLGTGTALTALYEKTPDRSSVGVEYRSVGVLGRRTVISAGYKNLSDGRRGSWDVGVPFYEASARRALVTDGTVRNERVLQFRDGVRSDSLERREFRLRLSGGVALSASPVGYSRVWFSSTWRREDFAVQGTVPFPRSEFAAVGAGVEVKRLRFQVLDSFNTFAREEDVDVSEILRFGLWAAPRAFGYGSGRAGIGAELGGQAGRRWPGGFAVIRAQTGGVLTAAGLDSARLQASVTVVAQNLPRQTLIVHAEAGTLRRPKPGDEFDLWRDNNGPRLFGAHAFTGTRMAWVALEDRVLVKRELLGLLGVGLAPFFDWGGAWYADEPARLGGDVGIALRLGPTRLALLEVGQFAVGYRFGQGFGDRRWAFTVRGSFAY